MKLFTVKTLSALAILSASMTSVFAESSGNSDGGLMAEMMAKRYPPKVISAPEAQKRLASVRIETSDDGGLMKEMMSKRYQLQQFASAEAQERLRQVEIPEGN